MLSDFKLTLHLANIILIVSAVIFFIVSLIPCFSLLDRTNQQNSATYYHFPKYAVFAAMIIIIPSLIHMISDHLNKNSFVLKGLFYRKVFAIVIIFPNVFFLPFIKSSVLLAMCINIQCTLLVKIVILLCLIPKTSDQFLGARKTLIQFTCVFDVAVLLLNYSMEALSNETTLILRVFTVILFLICFRKMNLNKQHYRLSFSNMLFYSSEFLDADGDESLAYIFSLIIITAGYIVFTILLLVGVVFEVNIMILVIFQIMCILPVMYVAKRFVYQLKLELESKKTFLRTTSHEIRTPMNTIVLGLNVLRKELSRIEFPNDELFEIIKHLDESAEVVLDLVNDLLTHDKIKEGIMNLETKPLSLWGLVDYTTEPFQTQARQSGIHLSIDSEGIPDVHKYFIDGDKHKLSQVFRNLLSNALKFTPVGKSVSIKAVKILPQLPTIQTHSGLKLSQQRSVLSKLNLMSGAGPSAFMKVSDSSRRTNKVETTPTVYMKIEVTDEGAGISEENISRLFKEIVQFNASELQGGKGSGLGMMITKGIVDLHGGIISVHSDGVGQGCVFTVYLPVYLKQQTETKDLNGLFAVKQASKMHTSPKGSAIKAHRPSPILSVDQSNSRSETCTEYVVEVDDVVQSLMKTEKLRYSDAGNSTIIVHSNPILFSMRNEGECQLFAAPDQDNMRRQRSTSITVIQIPVFDAIFIPTKLRILIVDDSYLNRKMLCRLIDGRCLETVEAENGYDAVEAVKTSIIDHEFPYDVILMDNRMPVMGGLTATKAIRELGYTGLLIGVTGDTQKDECLEFIHSGANNVLSKPIDLFALDRIIIDFFGGERSWN